MPARFGDGDDMFLRRADPVRGGEQLPGGDDLVVVGAEQEDRVIEASEVDLSPQRDEVSGGEPVLLDRATTPPEDNRCRAGRP